MEQNRGMMQSSLGELSEKLLGKDVAAGSGLVEGGGDADMEVDSGAGRGNNRPGAAAPSINPFRSKPRAAPVAIEPDPQLMDAPIDPNFNLQAPPAMVQPP